MFWELKTPAERSRRPMPEEQTQCSNTAFMSCKFCCRQPGAFLEVNSRWILVIMLLTDKRVLTLSTQEYKYCSRLASRSKLNTLPTGSCLRLLPFMTACRRKDGPYSRKLLFHLRLMSATMMNTTATAAAAAATAANIGLPSLAAPSLPKINVPLLAPLRYCCSCILASLASGIVAIRTKILTAKCWIRCSTKTLALQKPTGSSTTRGTPFDGDPGDVVGRVQANGLRWVCFLHVGRHSGRSIRNQNRFNHGILSLCRGYIGIMEKKMETTI